VIFSGHLSSFVHHSSFNPEFISRFCSEETPWTLAESNPSKLSFFSPLSRRVHRARARVGPASVNAQPTNQESGST
jgi:hypothetical protein